MATQNVMYFSITGALEPAAKYKEYKVPYKHDWLFLYKEEAF